MSSSREIPPELAREMTPAVRAFMDSLFSRIDELVGEVDRLRTELKKSKRFGHGPGAEEPAKDESTAADDTKKSTVEKPNRKRGGQPGHPKAERALIPSEQCSDVVTCKPRVCRGCGGALQGNDSDPLRHQVTDIPPITPIVIEYQRHRLTCSCCGVSTCGELPEGVPTGMTGPRLTAIVGVLMALFRQSKRRVSLCCQTLFNTSVSPGLVVKLQNIVTTSARPAYRELVSKLPSQSAVNVDETPTRESNENAWIWTVVAATFTVFAVRVTKASCVIKSLLGNAYKGVVTSDRAKMYDFFLQHQWCWAHLERDFKTVAECGNKTASKLGHKLLDLTHDLFHQWHRVRDGTVTRATFLKHIRRLYGEVYLVLEEGAFCAHRPTAALCENLLNSYENLFTFAWRPGVEPTNNAAERALRHPVIWKQLSFGTQSEAGSRFVETLLTVVETCRQQKRDTLNFLTDSVHAHFNHKQGPSLTADGV
ncbi:MAG: IS66 family transposase [Planctomycetota bacterium]